MVEARNVWKNLTLELLGYDWFTLLLFSMKFLEKYETPYVQFASCAECKTTIAIHVPGGTKAPHQPLLVQQSPQAAPFWGDRYHPRELLNLSRARSRILCILQPFFWRPCSFTVPAKVYCCPHILLEAEEHHSSGIMRNANCVILLLVVFLA